jgi:hypothetical protein
MSKLESVLSARDLAVAAFIEHNLQEQNLDLTQAQVEVLYKAAKEFRESDPGRATINFAERASESAQ